MSRDSRVKNVSAPLTNGSRRRPRASSSKTQLPSDQYGAITRIWFGMARSALASREDRPSWSKTLRLLASHPKVVVPPPDNALDSQLHYLASHPKVVVPPPAAKRHPQLMTLRHEK